MSHARHPSRTKKDHSPMDNSRQTPLLALSALVAPFVFAHPAAAQNNGTLNVNSGDIVTVTSTGTISNRAGGTNTTSSYDAGANFEAVDAESGGVFTLAGGALTGEDGDGAIFSNAARITVSSGSVSVSGSGTNGLDAANGSTATVTGGTFTASGSGGSIVTPFATPGPTISAVDLYAESKSTITVTGGNFIASGTGATGFDAINNGVIDLFGTGFTVNGSPATGPLTSGSGTISGTLLNGNVLTNLPYAITGGTIEFNVAAAPEPSQYAALGLGVLGLGVLALRARRRAVA